MMSEASRWPAFTPSKPISLARAITVGRAALSSAQVNTVGFLPPAGTRINADAPCRDEGRKLLGRACTVVSLQLVAAGAGNHCRNDDAGVTLQRGRHVVRRGRRRRDEDNIGGNKLFIVGHPQAQLSAEGGCRRTTGTRSADRTACDVLVANAVAKSPTICPVPIATTFSRLILGLAALRRSLGSRNDDDLSDLDVAVQVVICVLATSRRSMAPMSGAL
jgi:hypothetical protein